MKSLEVTYRYRLGGSGKARRPQDAAEARSRLAMGNQNFATLLAQSRNDGAVARRLVELDAADLGIVGPGDAPQAQKPFAIVVGCSDARVPVELIFSEGPNDLFVIRVAGNGLGSDVLASLDYAAEHLRDSLKLVVVLAHSGCGAITAGVDIYLRPSGYLSLASDHALRAVLDRQFVVIDTVSRSMAAALGPEVVDRPGYRSALIEASIVANAAVTAYEIRQELARISGHALQTLFGVYVLERHSIWVPACKMSDDRTFATPPADGADFAVFFTELVKSDRITALLAA